MKMGFLIIGILFSQLSYANLCEKFENNQEYKEFLDQTIAHLETSYEHLCFDEKILDIEIAPSQIISTRGRIVEQMRVTLHSSYQSCQYYFNRKNQSFTKSNCYNTW